MSVALLLFPDFALIAIGVLLKRYARFEPSFWTGLERLVYFVLFPALLFNSTLSAKFDFGATAGLIGSCLAALLAGVVLGWMARPVLRPDPTVFASAVQCAFRFNSYIALAVAGRLAGNDGIALMAVVLGLGVPTANAFAVFALARNREANVLGEMVRNPLILATLGGLALNLAGTIVERPLLAWVLVVKLLVAPAVAWALATAWHLPPLQREIAILFAALPAASSAYILAVRMGGNGAIVAFLISASTVLSVATLPLWLVVAR